MRNILNLLITGETVRIKKNNIRYINSVHLKNIDIGALIHSNGTLKFINIPLNYFRDEYDSYFMNFKRKEPSSRKQYIINGNIKYYEYAIKIIKTANKSAPIQCYSRISIFKVAKHCYDNGFTYVISK